MVRTALLNVLAYKELLKAKASKFDFWLNSSFQDKERILPKRNNLKVVWSTN